MKYKRLLPALPFIIVFMILSITVELNVYSENSIVVMINRVLLPCLGLVSVAIVIPKINLKWVATFVVCLFGLCAQLRLDSGLGQSYINLSGPDHSSYYLCAAILVGELIFFFGGDLMLKALKRQRGQYEL